VHCPISIAIAIFLFRGGTHVSGKHLRRKRIFLMSAKAVIIPQRESRHA
jgi:hypothetical protein